MAEDTYEFTGKTVDEAVAEGLAKLKVVRSDVAVEVLSKGSRGIFGIGSEPARVRITIEPARPEATATEPAPERKQAAESVQSESTGSTEKPEAVTPSAPSSTAQPAEAEPISTGETAATDESAEETTESAQPEKGEKAESQVKEAKSESTSLSDEDLEQMASEMLGEIVRLMGYDARVESYWQPADENDDDPYLILNIEGQDLGSLIGRRGETLANLQYLVRLMVNQRIKQWRNIVVDVEKYKERREQQLSQLALRMADQVADSGRATALEPMPPNERRLVHLALRDHELVYTQSSGEGDRRKVNIVPRDTA